MVAPSEASARVGATYIPSEPSMSEFYSINGLRAKNGIAVTSETALNYAAAYRAVTLIATSLASMPIHICKMDNEGNITKTNTKHPTYRMLNISPDKFQTAYSFRENIQVNCLTRGAGYARILRDKDARAISLEWLAPTSITPCVMEKGKPKLYYKYFEPITGAMIELDHDEVFVIPALTAADGFSGVSPITYARESIAFGLAADKYSSDYLAKGGAIKGFLTKDARLGQKERDELRAEWVEFHEGLNNLWQVGILSGGMGWQDVNFSPSDIEFLATRKFQISEIARWFGVPPHMLGDLENVSYTNAEQMFDEFIKSTLLSWMTKWSNEIRMKLFTYDEARSYCAIMDCSAIALGDVLKRAQANQIKFNCGVLNINEWRSQEKQPTIGDNGNKFFMLGSQLSTVEDVIAGKNKPQSASDPSSPSGGDNATPKKRNDKG
jgi:HK97 family phage portal protein